MATRHFFILHSRTGAWSEANKYKKSEVRLLAGKVGIRPISEAARRPTLSARVKYISESAVILLAEDEEDYILLIRDAFHRAGIRNPLYVVWTGEEMIHYLKGHGKYANRAEYPLPDILLLDLKMPRMNGFEVLEWVRNQPSLARLLILVLTSSDEACDVNKAYQLGANSFMVKPIEFEDLTELSRLIKNFWLEAADAPQRSGFRATRTTSRAFPKPGVTGIDTGAT